MKNNSAKDLIVFSLLGVIACIAFSCAPPEDQTSHFFSVDSLISAQANYLTASKARLKKDALLHGKSDSTSYVPKDSLAWSQELGSLANLGGINKPLYSDRYKIRDAQDPNSNLMIRFFEGTEDKKGHLPPLSLLKVYYHRGNISAPVRIEGRYSEENDLYKSSQYLTIDFQEVHNKMVLTSYSIQGSQKMILADSLNFSVQAHIILN